jgi:hypothetical protein
LSASRIISEISASESFSPRLATDQRGAAGVSGRMRTHDVLELGSGDVSVVVLVEDLR